MKTQILRHLISAKVHKIARVDQGTSLYKHQVFRDAQKY